MAEKRKSRGAGNQQVGRAGEYFVVAELNKRGAFAVPFAGNMPKIDFVVHPKSWTITLNKVDCSTEGVQYASKTEFQR